MKTLTLIIMLIMSLPMTSNAGKQVSLDDVVNGTFRAKRHASVTPLPDGESYACYDNEGRIVAYSYKTGKQTRVLFDPATCMGESIKSSDSFIMSPDGEKILIATNTKYIYRRSFTAEWYIYNTISRQLSRLSDGGPQQSPVWSPDATQVAFVRENNIYLVKLLYDNAESQVTKDGRRNEIINGIPDWVNEEEL